MLRHREYSSWGTALEDLRGARSILLLGGSDTGKTIFLTWAAATLQSEGRRLAIVDADIGQSSIGPPTTIGMSVVDRPFRRLQELAPAALFFVGSTTPRGYLLPMVVGTRRMVDRAHALVPDIVVIDTCGFIDVVGGLQLKQAQIAVTDPEIVVSFQRSDECERILDAYRCRKRPTVIRLRPVRACRRRSMAQRRFYREQALQHYFAEADVITLCWDNLDLVETPLWHGTSVDVSRLGNCTQPECSGIIWAECENGTLHVVTESPLSPSATAALARATGQQPRTWMVNALYGTLLGLLDASGDALGIGILQRIDGARHALEVLMPRGLEGIAGLRWSQLHLESPGRLRMLSP